MSTAAVGVSPSVAVLEKPIDPKLTGVGGWLLFFCISTTILSPVAVLNVFLRSQTTEAPISVNSLAVIAISVLGIVAGLSVWTSSTQAIQILRVYFLVLGGFALFSLSFRIAAGGEDSNAFAIAANVRTLLFVTLWVAYFHKSERVRANFGRNL